MSENDQKLPANPLNRRKPENRWRRILRDAEWDQHETVRRWLKFSQKLVKRDDSDKEKDSEAA